MTSQPPNHDKAAECHHDAFDCLNGMHTCESCSSYLGRCNKTHTTELPTHSGESSTGEVQAEGEKLDHTETCWTKNKSVPCDCWCHTASSSPDGIGASEDFIFDLIVRVRKDPQKYYDWVSAKPEIEAALALIAAEREAAFERGRIAEAKTCEETQRHAQTRLKTDLRAALLERVGEMETPNHTDTCRDEDYCDCWVGMALEDRIQFRDAVEEIMK